MELKDIIKKCEIVKATSTKGTEYFCVEIESNAGKSCRLFFSGDNRMFPDVLKSELEIAQLKEQKELSSVRK